MSEKITAVRCEGPCGKIKPFTEYHESRPGRRRRQCKACFNERRLGKSHQGDGRRDGKPVIRQERLEAVVEHNLRSENRALRADNEQLRAELAGSSEYNEIVKAALAAPMRRARIQPREKQSGLREGTPLVLASDWHVEEEVKPERVAGRNRYNLQIAVRRMQRFFEATLWAIRQQRDTFKIRDLILWLGGDFMTNFLHEDDIENNQLPPLETVLFLQAELVKGLLFLLGDNELEQIIIPMNDGNHSRTTKKLRAATRVDHSLEVFLYAQLKLRFANEPRLKFIMPTSQFTFLDDVYGKTIRFLHGDVFNYVGGVGGLTIPLLRSLPRWDSVRRADLTCMGHWHQRICLPNIMVNGSMIGYNGFAMSKGLNFEAPSQSLRMIDSRRWTGADIPLYVAERDDDVETKGK